MKSIDYGILEASPYVVEDINNSTIDLLTRGMHVPIYDENSYYYHAINQCIVYYKQWLNFTS